MVSCLQPDKILSFESLWPQLSFRLPRGYISPVWYAQDPSDAKNIGISPKRDQLSDNSEDESRPTKKEPASVLTAE